MESEFIRTKDHDGIRSWIEEHGGAPVTVTDEGNAEIINLIFGADLRDFTEISWEEFFAWFDEEGLVFEYAEEVLPGEEAFSYHFASSENVDDSHDDETELAEDNEMGEENMHDQLGE